MTITLNGRTSELPDGTTIATLLDRLGLGGRPVAVEVNREVVPRARHAAVTLAEGDRVEVIAMVGGG